MAAAGIGNALRCAVLWYAVQLLETSGVADVEPLASLLTSSGFKLAGVVAVVDAEVGSSQLQQQEVALAQVCTHACFVHCNLSRSNIRSCLLACLPASLAVCGPV